MPYNIANEMFATKDAITARCRLILQSTLDGNLVQNSDLGFLISLFQYHDEWPQKATPPVVSITTQTTDHGTRCFCLVRTNHSTVDISFPHAIKLIPTSRSANRLPQALVDYKNAARTAVQNQVRAFRDLQFSAGAICPITQVSLNRDNVVVDHELPLSFDQLLYNFTISSAVNPLGVVVDSVNGTVATFADQQLSSAWESYHENNCSLRLVSTIANLQIRPPRIDWSPLCQA